ncbi:translational machinery component [Aspergillus steynii IBT 23096]|uniref:Translational machinery component n=1 Tax=Aspergillus steynii IBT 23096 TaxID=1392250 RepID=A0A2I2FTM3_9EURO|nr:translational machinery component [Aspergillus steynii IBT 23096]PLB43951.1 translational machinery component [Aspergillus steynii IBT 23096]
MNPTFVNTVTRSMARPCQLQGSLVRSVRPFSTTQKTFSDARDRTRQMERQILNISSESGAAANDNSPLNAITRMMEQEKIRTNQSVTRDYSRMAEVLEADLIKQPYSDRAPPHHLHVFSHRHNTILTLTRPNGNPILSMGCGNLGFRKAQRGGYDSAYQLTAHVFGQMQERGLLPSIKRLEIIFRGFQQGREAFTKVLLGNEGRNVRGLVSGVSDATRLKFGGTRSQRVRRL